MRRLADILRARDGAAALELAIIAPVIGGLIMVAMDFSNAWAMRLALEQVAQRSVELAAVRKGVAANYDYIRDEAVAAWGKPFTSAVVDSWLECGGTRQSSTTANCAGAQRARYVSVRISADFQPTFGWGRIISGNRNGGFNLTGDATVRVQ
ncbi:TadE/TadG family type IV pilus assembly protein [Sandarakinorhabdus sp.]|uniref:TadE/TadG family type IV pilus assembly protein n=1 Tax=Sandarakinorhabdus sp. TaxID=1916663 RepID=UPI003F708822